MNIHDFENHIPKKILDRGFSYYEYGNLQDHNIEQVFEGVFEATVFGTEDYDVQVKMDKDQNILSSACSCPYEWSEICKHIVAVLYYVQDSEMYEQSPKTSIQELKEEIHSFSEKKAKDWLLYLLVKHKNARQDFLDD
ncbi:MAG: hypothetical protein GY810_07650 [Aureispira sp.]|nr:hypothetical protein [Aureispira sp.]